MRAATALSGERGVDIVRTWGEITTTAPRLAATMQAYLDELGKQQAPATTTATDTTLRQFAGWLGAIDPTCTAAAGVDGHHLESYRRWLSSHAQPSTGRPVSAGTVRYRVRILQLFFARIVAWGYPDRPAHRHFPAPAVRSGDLTPRSSWRPRQPRSRSRGPVAEMTWEEVGRHAPQMAATMAAYLDQLAVSARPATVGAYSLALRMFAAHVVRTDPTCMSVAAIARRHIESYKLALAARRSRDGTGPLSTETVRNRIGMLRSFFERLIDWDYPDAPRKVPVFAGDMPKANEPTPKFLDDPTAAKFMAALATDPNRRRRVMVELLARTGMRAGELAALEDDAMYRSGDTYWLRIPLGKLHNDRTVPLHPMLVGLINDYRSWRGPSHTGLLVERDDYKPFDRRTIHRYVAAVAKRAGVGHVHPHQLRHTLATQMINRGMSLEAIAALLGHRSPRMTLVYARISDVTVAKQYFDATTAVEADAITTSALKVETRPGHDRLLGNGHCTRPLELDCRFQTICEGCGFFTTTEEFAPVLFRQRDDAVDHADAKRAAIFSELIDHLASGEHA